MKHPDDSWMSRMAESPAALTLLTEYSYPGASNTIAITPIPCFCAQIHAPGSAEFGHQDISSSAGRRFDLYRARKIFQSLLTSVLPPPPVLLPLSSNKRGIQTTNRRFVPERQSLVIGVGGELDQGVAELRCTNVSDSPGSENGVRNRFKEPTSLIACSVLSWGVAWNRVDRFVGELCCPT